MKFVVKNIQFVLISVLLIYSHLVYASDNSIVAGTCYFHTIDGKPCILKKGNLKDSPWSFAKISGIPSRKRFSLDSVKCIDDNCVAVGTVEASYDEDLKKYFEAEPLLLTSKDNGTSWVRVEQIEHLPNIDFGGNLKSVVCENKTCVAVGSGSFNYHEFPLFLVSHDKGQTWKSQNIVNQLPNARLMAVNAVYHANNALVAVGYIEYQQQGDAYPQHHPLIIRSLDEGETWNYVADISGIPQNTGFSLDNIICTNQYCIASGLIASVRNNLNAILLTSTDQGASWKYNPIANLPANINVSGINSISCSDKNCVAVGSYFFYQYDDHPLLLVSNDYGQLWSFIQSDIADQRAKLTSVSCYGNICAAAGYSNKDKALLIISNDNLNTWHAVGPMPNNILPSTINCSEKECLMGGGYYYNDIFLVKSDANQTSWNVDRNIINIPKNFQFMDVTDIL